MFNLEYGLLFLVIGVTCTIGGFFIAFQVATYKPKSEEKEKNALTDFNKINKEFFINQDTH
ncbi:MAG: hypothetical protein CMH03_00065 [Marinovum sp.]|nr:hypothetical protein [Marinovum sp.]|tara:strand:- start:7671 stop:7853 length:183 start_codon:yes stop_codon:yes gene_type:complete